MSEVHLEAFNLLCGNLIGSGMTRKVFECAFDKTLVIKVEDDEVRTHFQNMMEWFVWNQVCGTDWEKWFCPVREISPNGRLLIMPRTSMVSVRELPDRLPKFLMDLKPSNFGMYQDRFVCHDYGTSPLINHGLSNVMRKAEWRLS